MKIAYLVDGVLKVFDGNNEPLFIILDNSDKTNIKNMLNDAFIYCQYPSNQHASISLYLDELEKYKY